MGYRIVVVHAKKGWGAAFGRELTDNLRDYGIDCHTIDAKNRSRRSYDDRYAMETSDLMIVVYTDAASRSEFVHDLVNRATEEGRKVILLKERGLPVRGRLYGFELVEYDASQPGEAIGRLVEIARTGKRGHDLVVGAAALVGVGLAAGAAYLLYRLLKK